MYLAEHTLFQTNCLGSATLLYISMVPEDMASITVDEIRGFIYWTDGTILKQARPDGSNSNVILNLTSKKRLCPQYFMHSILHIY